MTEQQIMGLAERAGFGGQQRNTLKMKLMAFASLVASNATCGNLTWVDGELCVIKRTEAFGKIVDDGGIPI